MVVPVHGQLDVHAELLPAQVHEELAVPLIQLVVPRVVEGFVLLIAIIETAARPVGRLALLFFTRPQFFLKNLCRCLCYYIGASKRSAMETTD